MSSPATYLLVSLPLRIFDSGDQQAALTSLGNTVSRDNGEVLPFPIPDFKIGTLDALVQQAEDLAKLDAGCAGVVQRLADSLRSILDGDEEKTAQHRMVNDSNRGPARLECAASAR
jgi:V-type H+-transporting ATPase subunit C